ncbi:MAG TPA: glucosamine-6-phosphate deaminase [Puia sp.]
MLHETQVFIEMLHAGDKSFHNYLSRADLITKNHRDSRFWAPDGPPARDYRVSGNVREGSAWVNVSPDRIRNLEETIDLIKIIVKEDPSQLGKDAGSLAAEIIRKAIEDKGQANIILATGTSQFETLKQLRNEKINWNRVTMFHLDEYIGLPETSPASFRKYLRDRFVQYVAPLQAIHLVNGEADPATECKQLGQLIGKTSIDVALVGIGENGHLGFNDPPADFETEDPFIVVELDEKCRRQQLGEGWFTNIQEVPQKAITMSIRQILKSRQIICSVPDRRKAEAIRDCFENPVSNLYPAGILQLHANCICFLDKSSSALLKNRKPDGIR